MSVSFPMNLTTIEAQHGVGLKLKKDQCLKVIDVQGRQVADLFCADAENTRDSLSAGRTIDYNESVYLRVGSKLYGHSGLELMEIVEDTCGQHDILVTPCSLQMFQMVNKNKEYHRSCHENLVQSLKPYGIDEWQITSTFNVFMHVLVRLSGKIDILPPLSKGGDYVVLRACRDLVLGLTACSDEGTNDGQCKPIQFQVFNGPIS